MIAADLFIGSGTLILAFIFFIGEPVIWQIYLLLSLRSVGTAFHTPAMQAAIPTLVPESQLVRGRDQSEYPARLQYCRSCTGSSVYFFNGYGLGFNA